MSWALHTESQLPGAWGGGGRPPWPEAERHGSGRSYLLGSSVSWSPAPETWSFCDYELLMTSSSIVKQPDWTGPQPLSLCLFLPSLLQLSHASFSAPQKVKSTRGKLMVSPTLNRASCSCPSLERCGDCAGGGSTAGQGVCVKVGVRQVGESVGGSLGWKLPEVSRTLDVLFWSPVNIAIFDLPLH